MTTEGIWVAIGQMTAIAGALAGMRLITEILSPAAYGELALGLTMANLANQTIMGPLGNGISRYYAPAVQKGDLGGYLDAVRRLMIAAGGGILALGVVVPVVFAISGHTRWVPMALASLALALFSGYNATLISIHNAARKRLVVSVHQGLDPWLRFAAAAILGWTIAATSTVAMLGFTVASIVLMLSQWMLIWGGFAGQYAVWLVGGMVAVMVAAALMARGFFARHGLTGAMARIPGLRERSRLIELSRLYMTQGMLMAGGIPAVEALELAATVLSPASRERSLAALREIRTGRPLSDAFDAAGLATPIALKYFRAGERSGNLADMLTRAARFYDDELARFIERFSKAFEPLLMAAIGIVVGVIVVMLYLPIFDLAGSLG